MTSQANQSSIFLDVFRRADKKDNGQISWEEFVSFFADGVMGKEELETLFKQIDTHNTNYIDPGELCQFFSQHLGEFKQIYDVVEDLHTKINTALHTTAKTYPAETRMNKFIKRFLMKEVTNQVSALQLPLESASEGMDELAKEESGDIKPVEASDVLKKSDITPGRVGRRAKRQTSNQSQNSIFDGTMSSTLTAQVDRLSVLLDRLEHGVNTDGFVDEDLEALSSDKYYLVEFETNIKEIGANNAEGCLSTCVRYYKDIRSFALYEIWDSEENFKKYNGDGTKFSVQMKDYIDGPVNNKGLDFPASWWKKNA
ncbi:unnamed protein product [Mytilus coruscus]|uniref:EF-hand domain-containing protein n=1 Tax=Mytilus coruscus TaxID=42192 RepID=A0A6J8EJD4_MYTCO|nr:unnamed protein product [Mytilus coruscus]